MTSLTNGPEPNSSDHREKVRAVAPRTGSKILRIVAVIVIALGVGFFFAHRSKNYVPARLVEVTSKEISEAPAVTVFTITPSAGTQTLKLPGETAAWNETAIYARVNGYVAKWFADIGDNVTAGQTLAVIETPELDAELLAAEAKLNAAIAQVAVRQAKADFAVETDQRWRDSPKGVVSDQERESKKAGSAEAVAELNAAHARVMLQQADVDRLTALTQFKDVKAPFDGTIIQRQIDIGNLVTAGSTANTRSLYRLSENSPMRIFVYAPQNAAQALMKPGTNAVITSTDTSGPRFEGKVARTARAINPQSRTIRIEIDVPNTDRSLVPGMYVLAEFELTGSAPIQIPAAAMMYRSGGPQVAVVEPSGAVSFKDVTIASDDGNMVSIGSGLSVGEKVALNLSSQIAEGAKVRANSDDAKSPSFQKPVR